MLNVLFSGIDFMFSPKGRMRRLPFWGYHIGMIVLAWVTLISLAMAYLGPVVELVEAGVDPDIALQSLDPDESNLFLALFLMLNVGFTWSTYAVTARRWHDRDKSGWWSLIVFLPVIGVPWIFIECGFLPGTRGMNRFGAAPGSSEGDFVEVFE